MIVGPEWLIQSIEVPWKCQGTTENMGEEQKHGNLAIAVHMPGDGKG